MDKENLRSFADEIRIATIRAIAGVGNGHVGGSLSIVDLLACLYGGEMNIDPQNPRWDGRDRLIISKGHSGPALYAALALRGFIPRDMLKTLNQGGTNLPSHCDRFRTPGVDMTTGSLGQGASSAVGIAYACRIKGNDNYVYLILGDGECQEGQVWEASMFAAARTLDHLIGFVDMNGLQIGGTTDQVMPLGDLAGKFKAFGWNVIGPVNGHEHAEILGAIDMAKHIANGKPTMILLKTVKGYGWKKAVDMGAFNHSISVTEQDAADFEAEVRAGRLACK